MTKQATPFAILTPEQDQLDDREIGENYAVIRSALREADLSFTPVYGVWNRKPEHSFLVLLPEGNTGPGFDTVLSLAAQAKQDSILYVDSGRDAVLVGIREPGETRLGHWQTIPSVGDRPDSYTVGPDGRVYCAMGG
jgi:hypothetical protein